LAACAIRNRSVIRKTVNRILIATPAGCAHLMPEEGADRHEECGAHEKRRRKHRQVLQHRAHLLQADAILAGAGRGRLPSRPPRRPAAGLRRAGASLAFWLIAPVPRWPARARQGPGSANDHEEVLATVP
jgi:hypothetical protein